MDYFKNKRITVMGLGLLGRGVGVINFLADQGASLLVTDLKTKEELSSSLAKLAKYKNIKYVLGEHRLEDFRDRDLIIRAPNAPLDSIYLQEARKNNIPIEMDASLFAKLVPTGVILVGITGTRGKSTVTHLLDEILQNSKLRSYLGGNVRGVATLPLLKKVKPKDVVVMELDSWQCQGFGDSRISPQVAVFTSFMNDHMNYYQGDMERYFNDKANIYRFQTEGDLLIVGKQVWPLIKKQDPKLKQEVIVVDENVIPENLVKLPGVHNRYNMAIAAVCASCLGVDDKTINKVLKTFKGVPGRLELIKKLKGVSYYNDTTATSPDGLYAAVSALKDKGSIILLAGGTDALLDYSKFNKNVLPHIKKLILFKGSASDKILAKLPKKNKSETVVVSSMKEALIETRKISVKGDIVLLSPGAKSFGLFKNEFDRGDKFTEEVGKLK